MRAALRQLEVQHSTVGHSEQQSTAFVNAAVLVAVAKSMTRLPAVTRKFWWNACVAFCGVMVQLQCR